MSTAQGNESKKREATKERLLEAGRELLQEFPGPSVADHIRSVDVTRRAKMSPGALYYHWENQEEYNNALVDYVLDEIDTSRSDWLEKHFERFLQILVDDEREFDEAVRAAGDTLFNALTTDPRFAVQVGLWSSRRKEVHVTRRLRHSYHEIEELWVAGAKVVLRRQNRVIREPFTIHTFVTAMISMAEGMLFRYGVDAQALNPISRPDSSSWSVFSTAVLALYLSATVSAEEANIDIRDVARAMPLNKGVITDRM